MWLRRFCIHGSEHWTSTETRCLVPAHHLFTIHFLVQVAMDVNNGIHFLSEEKAYFIDVSFHEEMV